MSIKGKISRHRFRKAMTAFRHFVASNPCTAEDVGADLMLWWFDESRRVMGSAWDEIGETADKPTMSMQEISALLAIVNPPSEA